LNTFPRSVSAILFDLDGVLVDTARAHFGAWLRLARQLGLPFDEEANERLKGVGREESLDLLLGPQASSVSGAEKRRLAALKNDWYREMIAQLRPADLLPGAREVLETVKSAGVRTGLTSASRNAKFLVGRLEIEELLDTIVDGGTIAHGKPAPEIYLRGASDLAVPPVHCLGVEDAIAGVKSIAAAGMASIGIGSRSHLVDADAVIATIAEFRLSDYRIESHR
jgi:beta-phosphoglucomutase